LGYCKAQIYSWFARGIKQFPRGARTLGSIKHGQISDEKVVKPAADRGSVARGSVSLCFCCSFILSINTDSGTVKQKILEEVDLTLNRIKLIYASEDACYSFFA